MRSVRTVRNLACMWLSLAASVEMHAQHASTAVPLVTRAPKEATQYDFLLGQWDLTVTPKAEGLAQRVHGVPKLSGTWKASRALDGWGIDDELRVVDKAGNPLALTHFVRLYDSEARQWRIVSVDAYRHRITTGTATWSNNEMTASSDGVDKDGKPVLLRTHTTNITANGFRFTQDRSSDGGKNWDDAVLVIEARLLRR